MKVRVERTIGKNTLSLETGLLAKQAHGAVLIQYGDTTVLSATATGKGREGIDFFPLTCDYRERTAAAGKFPGGFIKREGRPTTKETLSARLIDRPIRPMFPDWFRDEVQVQNFVLSSDRQNDGDVLAMNGASAALSISEMPFEGPVGSVRMGYVAGQWVPFPTFDDLEESDLEPDRFGHSGSRHDDRRFRPRNAGRPDGRGDHGSSQVHSADLRDADRVG